MSEPVSLSLVTDTLRAVHSDPSKTAEQWFDEFALLTLKERHKIPEASCNSDGSTKCGGQLVSFRGMVSNQLNVEYYVHSFVESGTRESRCGAFAERSADSGIVAMADLMGATVTRQRQPVLVKPVPGESQWYSAWKRAQTGAHSSDSPLNAQFPNGIICKFYAHESNLKICDEIEVFGLLYAAEASHSPVSDAETDDACDSGHGDEKMEEVTGPRLRSAFEPLSAGAMLQMDADTHDSDAFLRKLPTLHVFYYRSLGAAHKLHSAVGLDESELAATRKPLVDFIAAHLGGDSLAAEYVLLNMLSSVVSRATATLVGYFSLALLGFGTSIVEKNLRVERLKEMYSTLLCRVKSVDLSVAAMNAERFVPVKNHSSQELECATNTFQFVEGTQIVLNQTALESGKLETNGVLNIGAIKQLIEDQKVTYDFEFHGLDFACNLPVVLLQTERGKMGYQSHITVPTLLYTSSKKMESICEDCIEEEMCDDMLVTDYSADVVATVSPPPRSEVAVFEEMPQLTETELTAFRRFIAVAKSRVSNFELTADITKSIEEEFVEMRRSDANAGPDALHMKLTLLRLANASLLRTDAMADAWQLVKRLESERNSRMQ